LLKQLLHKLQNPQSFRIHLDEITDVSDEVQLMSIVGLPMRKKILEHYLYCLKVVGLCPRAQAISAKFNDFIEERGLDWKKCMSVTTDGEAAMQASPNGVIRNITIVCLDCVSTHCLMIHLKTRVFKRLIKENNQRSGLEIVLDDVIKIVIFICSNSKKHRMFSELRKDMEADAMRLHHAEVQ